METKTTDVKTSEQNRRGSKSGSVRLSSVLKSPAKFQTLEALESYIDHSLERLESQFSRFITFNSSRSNSQTDR